VARSTGFAIAVQMKVAPSHEVIHLAYLYTKAKQTVVNWLVETKPSFKNKTDLINILHHEWYEKLKQMGLTSRLAEDCYRDAGNVYLSWLENPNERKSKPRVKNVSVILTPKASYNLDLTKMRLSILGYETPILGYSRTLSLYKDLKIAEAKLVKRGKSWFLFITFRKKEKEKKKKDDFKPIGLLAVDINQDFITIGNDKMIVEIPTRLNDAYHYVLEAQKLQQKYPYKWRYSKRIVNRIVHFFRREKNILTDFAKKVGKWVVEIALLLKANVIFLERLNRMISHVNDLKKDYRLKLYLMQYRRIQWWIEWQAKKHGLKVIKVSPAHSSTTCPKCKAKMKENGYRMLKCEKCGFEEHRDYVAVMNLYGRGSLTLSTAHGMKGGRNHSNHGNPRLSRRGEVS